MRLFKSWRRIKQDRATRKTLIAARAVIADPAHWCKGTIDDGHGRHCALGALAIASPGGINAIQGIGYEALDDDPATLALTRVMWPGQTRQPSIAVVQFNDRRTHRAVLAAFDKAIDTVGA